MENHFGNAGILSSRPLTGGNIVMVSYHPRREESEAVQQFFREIPQQRERWKSKGLQTSFDGFYRFIRDPKLSERERNQKLYLSRRTFHLLELPEDMGKKDLREELINIVDGAVHEIDTLKVIAKLTQKPLFKSEQCRRLTAELPPGRAVASFTGQVEKGPESILEGLLRNHRERVSDSSVFTGRSYLPTTTLQLALESPEAEVKSAYILGKTSPVCLKRRGLFALSSGYKHLGNGYR
jgi:hypothetical protein